LILFFLILYFNTVSAAVARRCSAACKTQATRVERDERKSL